MLQDIIDKIFEAKYPIRPVVVKFWIVKLGKPNAIDELPFQTIGEALFFLKENEFKQKPLLQSYFGPGVLDSQVFMKKDKKLGVEYATIHE